MDERDMRDEQQEPGNGSMPSFLAQRDGTASPDAADADALSSSAPNGLTAIDTAAADAPQQGDASDGDAPSDSTPAEAPGSTAGGTPAEQGVNAVGAFFAEGVESVRAMHAARRAHADARDALDTLERTISERDAELTHRRDIAARYADIIKDETARREAAVAAKAQAEAARDGILDTVASLKADLDQMKEADATVERRLKSARNAAEAKEASARESGSRLQRRVDDAKRNLKKAEDEREEGLAAAERAIESARTHLATLQDEFAAIQRNPSANPAEYSVRSSELEGQIADATEALRRAQDDLPRIDTETQAAIEDARAAVTEAEKPIAAAKQAFEAVVAEADRARDAYEAAARDADERQKDLRHRISEQEKVAREQEQAADAAQADADAAQDALDEANDIHAHPEATEALARALATDRAERDEQAREVEELAAAEHDVRERTRGSRVKFIGALAAAGVIILVIVLAVIFLLPK